MASALKVRVWPTGNASSAECGVASDGGGRNRRSWQMGRMRKTSVGRCRVGCVRRQTEDKGKKSNCNRQRIGNLRHGRFNVVALQPAHFIAS
ncbi:hypothetical protein CSPX01_05790 [Colletotrichum filicis]|nr:hypothetical protein CSPX01_05790 [Colletotrichum filicis]